MSRRRAYGEGEGQAVLGPENGSGRFLAVLSNDGRVGHSHADFFISRSLPTRLFLEPDHPVNYRVKGKVAGVGLAAYAEEDPLGCRGRWVRREGLGVGE